VDRESLSRLRAQPGYLPFVGAATLARVSDEMFSVGAVLLVLDRTGSPELAGLVVSAITLPSLVTAPLLGAWLDLTGARRRLMVLDQVLIAVVLVGVIATVGHSPNWVPPLIVIAAGLTYPLSFGGFTSFIPAIVSDELLPPANALETSSFNTALVVGPALAGLLSAAFDPAVSLGVEAVLALVALVLILRIPGLDRTGRRDGRSLGSVVAGGLRQIVAVPELRGVTVAGALGLGGLGLMTVTFPLFAVEHLGGARSDAGFIWAAFAVGSMTGALGLVRAQRRLPPERVVVVGYALFGSVMLLWPLAGSLAVMLPLVALAGAADGPALAAQFAVRQQRVPRDLLGQVFTTAAGLKVGSLSIGAALAGPVATGLGSAEAILIAAGLQFSAAAAGLVLMRLPAAQAPRQPSTLALSPEARSESASNSTLRTSLTSDEPPTDFR
jgi:predicted MFS family arabinose efflux permease